MKCPKCGLNLPDDSLFCQYCGVNISQYAENEDVLDTEADIQSAAGAVPAIEEEKPEPAVLDAVSGSAHANTAPNTPQTEPQSAPPETAAPAESHSAPAAITGSVPEINGHDNKKRSFAKGRLPIIVLSVLAAVLAVLNVYQYVNGQNVQSALKEKNQIISLQKSTISFQQETIRKSDEQMNELTRKLLFYEEHAVVVPNDGTRLYHKYGCEYLDTSHFWYLDTSYFWIYNTEAAEGNGYRPCPHCHN